MSSYPTAFDQDVDIVRVDDNITEIGGNAINQLRAAVFAIERALGLTPGGTVTSVANRLNISINPDGTIKDSALQSVGLATLPITGNEIADGSVGEEKLSLDYSTLDLHTAILTTSSLLTSLTTFANSIFTDLNLHIAGATTLSDNATLARHVASQIDINTAPTDSRDISFNWVGLKDKDGVLRSATQVAEALYQINTDLTNHENLTTEAHPASAIIVDTDNFDEIPNTATDVQSVLEYLDDAEVINMGEHRATQHANGIPRIARSESLVIDGYESLFIGHGTSVVAPTSALTYLVHSPNTFPVDDLSVGDDIIKFSPDNSNFTFDAQFSQVKVGDIIKVNYGNGTTAEFPIESIRFVPGVEWAVRINGVNLVDSATAIARIDRNLADRNTAGILAVAAANAHDASGPAYTTILSSVIVAHPRSATALGLGFDANQLNSSHYNLYLEFYPTGNPTDHVISLPAIDVTGDAGVSPGFYTLNSVVQNINDQFRQFGFNYRFIAFEYQNELGISIADPINNAAFAIISGDNSSGTLATGVYTNNVIGGSTLDDFDALGFGTAGANIASPAYQSTWTDSTAALLPTKVIVPLKKRYYIANGQKLDTFADTYLATDGYWDGYISNRNVIGTSTVEVTYTILQNLKPAGLKPGKTLIIQPTIDFDNINYFDVDYGRFIIKDVSFIAACPGVEAQTQITVINGLFGLGTPTGASSAPNLDVKIYFGYDSVDFDKQNLIDNGVSATNYSRFHEIYITDEGKTFSHERARLFKQNESATLLGTSNWHMVAVSPKLRGYTDGTSGVFNKYLRFYVTNYNSTTGEYDGYLGQRVPSATGILKTGIIVTGRKNVITRFYDETNVDYIDLLFQDNSVSPGSNILSTNSPRYVDIELFDSLQTDDELLLLASCEVNWSPDNQNIVQFVTDLRQFGSVDETDFTDSAIEFISAGDKLLHQNGVIRGFDLGSISAVANSGEIFFKGGVALVDGRIVTANNASIVIPQVYPSGSSLPQTLDWAICVNKFGNLIPIIITATKDQFFATPGSSSYYLPSVTFDELVETRKDLLPIYIANVTIASLTVNEVTDIKRFIYSESLGNTLVWASDANTIGHFKTFESLKNWINNCGGVTNDVKARGIFEIDDSVDLTGFDKKVIIDGLNAEFNVNISQGFLLGNNITLQNCTFNYTPDPSLVFTSVPAGEGLLNKGNGCLYGESGDDISDVQINNCTFNCENEVTQRPPFILFEFVNGQINKNIVIQNNKFNDNRASTDLTASQAVIAFLTLNSGVSAEPSLLLHCFIKDNICNAKQSIFITTVADSGTEHAAIPGLNVINTVISGNICGIIGTLTSGVESSLSTVTDIGKSVGLLIDNNYCQVIATLYETGNVLLDANNTDYGLGKLTISNNHAHWISAQTFDIVADNQFSSLKIINNELDAFDSDYLDTIFAPAFPNYAISVANYSTENSECSIHGNIINFGRYDGTTYGYDRLIYCDSSAVITNNILKGVNASGYIIYAVGGDNTATRNYVIQSNKLYRGDASITKYIKLATSGTKTSGIITNNILDDSTIDGASDTDCITSNSTGNWIITQNKNQTVSALVHRGQGQMGIGDIALNIASSGGSTGSAAITSSSVGFDITNSAFKFHYGNTNVSLYGHWIIPFTGFLPEGVNIVSVTCTVSGDTLPDTTNQANLYLKDSSSTSTPATTTIINGSNTLTTSPTGFRSDSTKGGAIYLRLDIKDTAVALNARITELTVVYRW
jgi:hypothetical protein